MKSSHAEPPHTNVEKVLCFCVVDDQLFDWKAVKMFYVEKIWIGFCSLKIREGIKKIIIII